MQELTLRAGIAGIVVAAIMGASYPYIVLKLGFGPNVSVVAAFFGFVALGLAFKNYNRWENNIVQTAGTSAAQTAFMCVLLAAFDMLKTSKTISFKMDLSPLQSFAWLTAAGLLGVLLAVPMRQHFVVEEKLTYADGVAAAETLIVLDSRGKESGDAVKLLFAGLLMSGLIFFLQLSYAGPYRIPETLAPTFFGLTWASMSMGVSTSFLNLGSGALVGTRINTSMLLGTTLSWVVAPHLLMDHGIISKPVRLDVLRWVMWPATGMLVSGGLTALVLRWRILVRTFTHFSSKSVKTDEFPIKWVLIGAAIAAVALVVVQRLSLGIPIWMTLAAIVLSVPLMLVGLRVLGETNWGPISALSNLMQGIFAAIAPGNIAANMVASGTTGTIAADSEAIMQDYKAGHIIGSSPRAMTYAQLMAVPIGAAAVSLMYPLLRSTYGIGGEHGLSSPISAKWAGFAEFLASGIKALPSGALEALVVFSILGVVLTVLEMKWKTFTPSPTAIGMGMLIPGAAVATMFIGGLLDDLWRRASPRSNASMSTPLSSGLIAGEAIVAVVVPLLILAGLLSTPGP